MKSLKRLFFTAVFSLITLFAAAQRGPTYQADQAFLKGDYFDAATLYKKAFTKEKDKAKNYRAFIAIFIENIRLIDNISLN